MLWADVFGLEAGQGVHCFLGFRIGPSWVFRAFLKVSGYFVAGSYHIEGSSQANSRVLGVSNLKRPEL